MGARGDQYAKSVPELLRDAFFEGYRMRQNHQFYEKCKGTGDYSPAAAFAYSNTAYVIRDIEREDGICQERRR